MGLVGAVQASQGVAQSRRMPFRVGCLRPVAVEFEVPAWACAHEAGGRRGGADMQASSTDPSARASMI